MDGPAASAPEECMLGLQTIDRGLSRPEAWKTNPFKIQRKNANREMPVPTSVVVNKSLNLRAE
jgi:hypothetical protein